MQISYDAAKRLKTRQERGLDFEDAARLFAGVHYTKRDLRFDYGEDREISVGLVDGKVIVVVWTRRGGGRRIISMRRADQDEREQYHQYMDRSG